MPSAKQILYRLRFHVIFKSLIDRLFKLLYFFRFAQWMDENRNLAVNDFPAKGNVYKRRYTVHEHILNAEIGQEPFNYLEFGVADCETLFWWIDKQKHPASLFYGFDTFTGLPEDWGIYKKGTFDLKGEIPQVNDSRVSLHKGLFQDTLHGFLRTFKNDQKNLVLLDADLFSATLFVLTTIAPFLKSGDVLLFDEFNAPQHEYLALMEFCRSFTNIKVNAIAAANNYACVAFRVL